MIKRLLIAVAMLCAVTEAQVPVTPIVQPHMTFVDAAGNPCVGCKLYTYTAGTTTPFPTYVDSVGVSQNPNPIVLGADGGPQTPSGSSGGIWVGRHSYKFILKDALGNTIWTVDNVNAATFFPCGPANTVQIANSAVTGLNCDVNIFIDPTNHTLNVGTISANHVTIGALGTPTSWTFDTTTPATALASLGGGNGFISAAAYAGTFAQMMTDAATANSTITISTATPLASGTTTVSANRNLLGLGGGNFTCPTGTCTLAFSGGNFDAPSRTVFGSNVVVTGLKVAKPEWWGGTNPLLKIAIDGLATTGGKILLADQSLFVYRSGYDAVSGLVMSKNNIEIAGAGICTPLDDLSTCTGGSRIIGEFDNSASYLHYHDFGVDDGCLATATLYSGSPNNGIVFANPGQALTFREVTVNIERVSGLVCGSTSLFHAMLLENIDGLHANSVIAYGGTHGVVIKTLNSEVTGVVSKHHASECFYIKSDFYAPAGKSSLHGLSASDCQDGLLIQGFDADLKGFTANGINCDSQVNTCLFVTGAIGGGGFVTNGIVLSDITSYAGNALFSDPTVNDLQVSNLTQISPSGSLAINSANTVLHGCQILNVPVSIPAIIITASTSNAVISDCIISGTGTFGSPLSAISIGATNTVLSNIRLSGAWTGFCMVNVGTGDILSSNFLLTGSCALGLDNGNNFILNGNFQTTLVTNGTSTPNVIAIPGTVAPLGCRFEPGNSAAAGDAANDFIDTIVLHSLTFHHSATNAMAFRILCNY